MDTSSFQAIKLSLVNLTGLSKDALHVHVGLATFFIAGKVLRKPPGALPALVAVVMVAMLGETMDLRDDLSSMGYWQWRASLHDILNTLFWPLVISGLARWTLVFGKPE